MAWTAAAGAAAAAAWMAALPARPAPPPAAYWEPVTAVVRAGIGGRVAAVKVRPGEAVEKGQLLLEMEAVEGEEALERFLRLADGLPQGEAIEAGHKEVLRAEAEYVEALREAERHPGETGRKRLAAAERRREQVRRQVRSDMAAGEGAAALAGRLRALREVRSPMAGTVALLPLRAGDRAGVEQPLAIVESREEYTAELALPEGYDAERLRGAKMGVGIAVEEVYRRRVPFAMRKQRHVATEAVARLRLRTESPVAAGTKVAFALP
jgi:biotin carboxyl carrier protein